MGRALESHLRHLKIGTCEQWDGHSTLTYPPPPHTPSLSDTHSQTATVS